MSEIFFLAKDQVRKVTFGDPGRTKSHYYFTVRDDAEVKMSSTRQTGATGADQNWEREVYARGHQMNRWPFSNLVSAVLGSTASAERKNTRILEIGCGAGNNVLFLAKEGFQAWGIDGSHTAIDVARKRVLAEGVSADLTVGDMQVLAHQDSFFDIVLDRSAVTHNDYPTITTIFEEVRRVLRPHGAFMLFDLFGVRHPDRMHRQELSHNFYERRTVAGMSADERTSFFTAADLDELFRGFSEVQTKKITVEDQHGRVISETFDVVASK